MTQTLTDLSALVRTLGRGPGRSRNLTRDEAKAAMAAILAGTAPPEAVGAILMLMRYRAESGAEIAGFVEAMRDRLPDWGRLGVTLDWPSYASGRSRGLPLFLLAARLLAQSGQRVLVHGWNGGPNPFADVRAHLDEAGIPLAETSEAAAAALDARGIAYVPLEALDARILEVLRLRDVLGLRSPVNTALRALNPGRAGASVQGVFHPPYRELQQEAAALLGDATVRVIKGGGGEFERHPAKAIQCYGVQNGEIVDELALPLIDETRRLRDAEAEHGDLGRLWSGALDDPFAEAAVIGTAALALRACGVGDLSGAEAQARDLWAARNG